RGGHHAHHQPEPGGAVHQPVRVLEPGGAVEQTRSRTARCQRGARDRRRTRERAVPRVARRRSPGQPLLHAESLDRDAGSFEKPAQEVKGARRYLRTRIVVSSSPEAFTPCQPSGSAGVAQPKSHAPSAGDTSSAPELCSMPKRSCQKAACNRAPDESTSDQGTS